jgi:hypothetical protein
MGWGNWALGVRTGRERASCFGWLRHGEYGCYFGGGLLWVSILTWWRFAHTFRLRPTGTSPQFQRPAPLSLAN